MQSETQKQTFITENENGWSLIGKITQETKFESKVLMSRQNDQYCKFKVLFVYNHNEVFKEIVMEIINVTLNKYCYATLIWNFKIRI